MVEPRRRRFESAPPRRFELESEARTRALAARLAGVAAPPFVIHLRGGLGVGKTAFARALIRARGATDAVKSPTFGVVETYPAAGAEVVHHFDFYRFGAGGDWRETGLAELLDDDGALCVVEWPQRAPGLPPPDLDCRFFAGKSPAARRALIVAASARGAERLARWR